MKIEDVPLYTEMPIPVTEEEFAPLFTDDRIFIHQSRIGCPRYITLTPSASIERIKRERVK